MKQKVQFLSIMFVRHSVPKFAQEPDHYRASKQEDEPARPRLVLVDVLDNVDLRLEI